MSPMTGAIFWILGIIALSAATTWIILEVVKSSSRSYLIDHYESINGKLNPYGFSLEYQVAESYGQEVISMFRIMDNRTGISTPWADPSIAYRWIFRMQQESIEQVFSDALRYEMQKFSKRKALPFDIKSKRFKK
ncbi:hypothetical protein PHYNN_245 [Pantoea phage Phynn]|nr:hypothetical protein PHYNN_245 [Pantoea phage Phynn]